MQNRKRKKKKKKKVLANSSHKLIIAFRPLIEGLSKVFFMPDRMILEIIYKSIIHHNFNGNSNIYHCLLTVNITVAIKVVVDN